MILNPEQRKQLRIEELSKFLKSKTLMFYPKKYRKAVAKALREVKNSK